MMLQETGKSLAGELSPLVGVEDIRSPLLESLLQSLDAEVSAHGVG